MRKRGARTAKPDRRVQRTRQLLQDALIAMMIEKGYEATTVQDIIDRANVGRATFYAHFADRETLLASRIEDLRAMLTQQQRQALASPGGLRDRGLGFSLVVGLDLKAMGFKGTAEERALAVEYIAGAFMSVLTWWLDRGAKLPPQEVDEIFRRLVMHGVAAELGLRSAKAAAERS